MPSKKPDNPTDRRIAIMDLYDSGLFVGICSVEDMVQRFGGTSQGVTRALRALGFTIANRRSKRTELTPKGRKKKVMMPRKWARPTEWPDLVSKQRHLRKQGVSVGFAKRIFNSAAVPMDMFEEALTKLTEEGISVTRRGALKKAIDEVIAERDGRYTRNFITAAELSNILREAPETPARALLNMAEMYRKRAVREANGNRPQVERGITQ